MTDPEWLTGTWRENFKPCRNHACRYWVPLANEYCCMGCDLADQGGYEIHEAGMLGHGEWCARRSAPPPSDEEIHERELAWESNRPLIHGRKNMTSAEFLAAHERSQHA